MPWLKLRAVVVLPDAQAEIAEARKHYQRIDESIDGLKWLLSRNPQPAGSFPTVLNHIQFTMYGWRGTGDVGMPDMWVVYAFDDDEVQIHGINAMEPGKDEEEGEE